MHWLGSVATVFGLGFIYFISAIPAGAAFGLPVWVAALFAWAGYAAGGLAVAVAGEPVRAWLMKKLRVRPGSDSPNFVMRAWKRFGLPALGLIAPVTMGPQAGALLAIALGAKRVPVIIAFAIGAIPWAIAFAVLTAFGVRLVK